jgi:phosphoglycolate phosphatase
LDEHEGREDFFAVTAQEPSTSRRVGFFREGGLCRTGYNALVFDLDGTLWDAASASTYGWNLALEKMGLLSRVTVDGIRSVSGRPFERCVEILVPELHPAPEAAVQFIEAHERIGIEAFGGVLYEGVVGGLPRLAAAYPLFAVSNCPDWYLEAFFHATGLRECFTGWDCHGASGVGKSQMLLELATRHRWERAIYIGDTQGDADAATEAEMEFAYARYGFGETESPSLSFESFGELVQHFLTVRQAAG